jgi:hypothetical protein
MDLARRLSKATTTGVRRWVTIGLIGYALAGFALSWHYHQQINPDGVAYLSLANSYLHGYWKEALNGYWGPLFSWLLVPFLALRIDPLLATKLLNVMIGAFLLLGSWRLLGRVTQIKSVRMLLGTALIVMTLSWALGGPITPDLLVATLLVWYFNQCLDYLARPTVRAAAWCGVIGGAAYLAKSYALVFVAAHFVVMQVLWLVERDEPWKRLWRGLARYWLAGMAALLAVVLPWSVLISLKYHKLTIGTSAAYNLAVSGPHPRDHPMFTDGLLPPPQNHAVSIWDDPSYMNAGSPWPRNTAWRDAVAFVRGNLSELSRLLVGVTCLWMAVMVAAVVLAVPRRRHWHTFVVFGLGTGLLYASGYLLTFMDDRYFWPVYVLVVVGAGYILTQFRESGLYSRARLGLLVGVLFLSLIYSPYHNLRHVALIEGPVHNFAMKVKADAALKGARVASDSNWGFALFASYEVGARYYGQLRAGDAERQLALDKIDYVLVWDPQSVRFMNGYDLVKSYSQEKLMLYRRRQ